MYKRVFGIILLSVCIALTTTACESKAVKDAKQAYEEKDYSAVEVLLSDEEIEDPEIERILTISKIFNSYEDEKFSAVLEQSEKLGQEDLEDSEIKKMMTVSKAQLAFDQEKYLDVVNIIQQADDNELTSLPVYVKACHKYIDSAVAEGDAEPLSIIYGLDSSTSDYIYTQLSASCDNLDYKAFKYMENVLQILPDSDLKKELNDYLDSNKTNRIRAFLIGEWEWQTDDEKKTRVNLIAYKDNLLGEVTQVGDNEVEFQILKGDIYWKDFEFVEDDFYTCNNLCKTSDGYVVDVTATGKIDYEEETLQMHLTAPEPYQMVGADREWKRVLD